MGLVLTALKGMDRGIEGLTLLNTFPVLEGFSTESRMFSEGFRREEDFYDWSVLSESSESVESVDSEYCSLAIGFPDKASTPLFSFPCLYSNFN